MESFKIEPFLHSENSSHYINTKILSDLLIARPDQLFQPHRILFNCIHLFLEGEGVFHVDFKAINVKPRHILFVSPYQVSQFQHDPKYKSKVMIFTEDFFCKSMIQSQFYSETNLFNDPLTLPYFDLGERFEEVCVLFEYIQNELARPHSEMQGIILNNYLFNILLITEEISVSSKINFDFCTNRLLVTRFKSLVNKNLNQHYGLDYYSSELNVSLRTLQNAFLKVENQTPKQWLINRMILEIKRNLMYGGISISEIAYGLGFKEVTNFTKFFKIKTGLTPTQFRNNYGK
ncbi:helix-turn-helix transcriptional regulator [Chryseobacterium arthrosphaerae]|uniref:AraC family transcriptional regulator n=1 Tax=Chryseobacterium arthrosphaerae TaxID=651561 RepID=A0A1B8ZPF3_9FLAO|nr:helix-turn-helix transcriptional regulator [Chryseobacterium arthrosphaerae]AYZ11638.1 AraC family transcriptional regulator [Chryseobacterium arthrosphaerae]MDG4654828.1 helix-turn-helix transcriptional regulator [Chryseobacterium arthrosphaerae]OCA73482.1 AraC family transcriptional regulator [Chryseobacterium arthrosphaerae]QUY57067.1 AraC family transcriptional regulator [Chryseobacterium arthrosphaerae]UEQ76938.1 AraC family transcriptional regulator [Chryseobacterium arthrosphaerae]